MNYSPSNPFEIDQEKKKKPRDCIRLIRDPSISSRAKNHLYGMSSNSIKGLEMTPNPSKIRPIVGQKRKKIPSRFDNSNQSETKQIMHHIFNRATEI